MIFLRVCVTLGLGAGLLVNLFSFWAPWPGDMITPFRLYLLVLSVAGLIMALPFRRRWLIALGATVLAANALPVATRLIERRGLPASATGTPLSLLFSNVLCDNRHFDRVIALARNQNTDLFAAAETTPEWLDHLRTLHDLYPYSFTPDGLGNFGVALFAKQPFTAEVYRIGRYRMALARADFGDHIVYVAHPMPPANEDLAEDNRVYIEDLAARVAMETKPVIVAGDLNATLWSHDMASLVQQKMQWPKGSGMAYSWPASRSLLHIQIDQVLTTHARAGTYRVLPDVGSDHFPVRAEIWF